MTTWTEYVCSSNDGITRGKLAEALTSASARLDKHWQEIAIDIWTYDIGAEQLKVRDEYGEIYLTGPKLLIERLLTEIRAIK